MYHVQKLMDGVELFKIEVNDCVYEIFKSPTGEWKLLYCSPNSPYITVNLLIDIVEGEPKLSNSYG